MRHPVNFLLHRLFESLLMALPLCETDSRLEVTRLASGPYVKMTCTLLKKFGIVVQVKDGGRFDIAGSQHYPTSWVEARTLAGSSGALGRPLQWALRSGVFVTGSRA